MRAGGGYLMVLGAAMLWGSIGLFVNNLAALGVDSASMAAFRLLFGIVPLVPVLMVMGLREKGGEQGFWRRALSLLRVPWRSLVPCALVGIFGLALANCAYYESMRACGMSTASVLLYTSPVFGCILGRFIYGERLVSNKVVAVACNVIGCSLAVTSGDLSSLSASAYGIGIGVFAGFLGALLAVFSKMATERVHPLAVVLYGFAFGGMFMAGISAPWTDVLQALSPQLVAWFVGFGLIPTACAYILYMRGLSCGLEASKVPVIASVETVGTVALGIGVYGEPADIVKVAGICLVLASILIMNVEASRVRRSAVCRRIAEAARFNAARWTRDKAEAYERFLTDGDWQTWMPLR